MITSNQMKFIKIQRQVKSTTVSVIQMDENCYYRLRNRERLGLVLAPDNLVLITSFVKTHITWISRL